MQFTQQHVRTFEASWADFKNCKSSTGLQTETGLLVCRLLR